MKSHNLFLLFFFIVIATTFAARAQNSIAQEYYKLAESLKNEGFPEKAIEYYKQAVRLDQDNIESTCKV